MANGTIMATCTVYMLFKWLDCESHLRELLDGKQKRERGERSGGREKERERKSIKSGFNKNNRKRLTISQSC